MAIARIFHTLIDALKSGADITLARFLGTGRAREEVRERAESMLPTGPRSGPSALFKISLDESYAADVLHSMGLESATWKEALPVQPYLFGDEPGGLRTDVGVELQSPSGEKFFHRLVSDGERTIAEQIADEVARLKDLAGKYDELRERFGDEDLIDAVTARVVYGAKRF